MVMHIIRIDQTVAQDTLAEMILWVDGLVWKRSSSWNRIHSQGKQAIMTSTRGASN